MCTSHVSALAALPSAPPFCHPARCRLEVADDTGGGAATGGKNKPLKHGHGAEHAQGAGSSAKDAPEGGDALHLGDAGSLRCQDEGQGGDAAPTEQLRPGSQGLGGWCRGANGGGGGGSEEDPALAT